MTKAIIVTGSREWANVAVIESVLTDACPDLVVHGGAQGADQIADDWAKANGIDRDVFRANWTAFGKSAGPVRNGRMLKAYQHARVVAFPLKGPGTKDCIKQARALRMEVFVYGPDGKLLEGGQGALDL